MTDLELTKMWLNGYHELAITHGLKQQGFCQELRKMGYQSPALDNLINQLEREIAELD